MDNNQNQKINEKLHPPSGFDGKTTIDFGDFFEKIEEREKELQQKAQTQEVQKPYNRFSGFFISFRNIFLYSDRKVKVRVVLLVFIVIIVVTAVSYFLFQQLRTNEIPAHFYAPPAMPD